MKQKNNISKHRLVIPLVILIVVAIVTVLVKYTSHTDASVPSNTTSTKSIQSQFSFTGATGWHKGPTNNTSMALFSDDGSCFTSIEHKTGTINPVTAIQKQQSDLSTDNGTMTPGVTSMVTIQTNTGQQQYELHQYSLTSTGDEQLMGGLELGYLQLPDGYLVIQGHCNTADQLSTTIPALQAYNFNATN